MCSHDNYHTLTWWITLQSLTHGSFPHVHRAVSGTLLVHSYICFCLHQSHNFHYRGFFRNYRPMGKSSALLNVLFFFFFFWWGGEDGAAIATLFFIYFRISHCKITRKVLLRFWVGLHYIFRDFWKELPRFLMYS